MKNKISDIYNVFAGNGLSALIVKPLRNIILFCAGSVGGRPSQVGSGVHPQTWQSCHAT
jgi:hypothetical protein